MRFPPAVRAALILLTTHAAAIAEANGAKPMLSATAASSGASGLVETDPPVLRYANIHADSAGATHVEYCTLRGFALNDYAPPATPQWLGIPPGEIKSIGYGVLPVGYVATWHHSPGLQWVFVLSGRWSVETTDGGVLQQGPGDFQLNAEDGASPQGPDGRVGHLARQVGDVPTVQLFVSLKEGSSTKPPARCGSASH